MAMQKKMTWRVRIKDGPDNINNGDDLDGWEEEDEEQHGEVPPDLEAVLDEERPQVGGGGAAGRPAAQPGRRRRVRSRVQHGRVQQGRVL